MSASRQRKSYFLALIIGVGALQVILDKGNDLDWFESNFIIIGSVNGDRVAWPGATAYALSKSAVQGIGRGLARDFGARGITVNVVQPGPVDTDMNPAGGPMAPMMHAAMAIKRHATADEVAALVLFLASPAAAMITGGTQTIDGGVGI